MDGRMLEEMEFLIFSVVGETAKIFCFCAPGFVLSLVLLLLFLGMMCAAEN